MLKEFTTYIANESSFVIGTDLFAGFFPSTFVSSGIVLIRSGGQGDFYLPDFEAVGLQAISRSPDYFIAETNAKTLYDLIHGLVGVTLPVVSGGPTYVLDTCNAVTLPQSLGQDEKGNFILSTNFIVRVQTG